jgi:hypothetical protein
MEPSEHPYSEPAPEGPIGIRDRRAVYRFPVQEELHYRLVDKGPRMSGVGRTLNMGSRGLYFSTEETLPLGRTVEVSVNWPARLENACLLKFVATGKIIRSDRLRAALRIERYEFRTRSANPIRGKVPLS